jgi:phosphohistidine swiveling domain-containing protein
MEREKIRGAIPDSMMEAKFESLPSKYQNMLQAHSKKWFWMENNSLETKVLEGRYFWGIIKQEALGGKANEVKGKSKGGAISRKERAHLMEKLSLGKEMRPIIAIMDEFGNFQDIRKMYWIKTMHYFDLLFSEMAKRKRIGIIHLKNAFPWEIKGIMAGRGIRQQELRARENYSLTIFKDKTPELLVGKKARAKTREIYGDGAEIGEFSELHGICASAGKVIGRAAILTSVRDVPKLKKGDIMIAPATDPEYIIAMKKAAAIVTDEGGITSHAAIVSRELGIPCLVGTKFASKVFKDGELVELDANHGVIRRLK